MQLGAIKDVYAAPGPYITIHAAVGRASEDAAQQATARWTTIRHELARHDIGDALLRELHEHFTQAPGVSGEARRTLVAASDGVMFDQTLAGSTSRPETVEVAPLPDFAGWLAQAERQQRFALVVADREGADISFHDGLAVPGVAEEQQVQGEEFGLTKVRGGEWAHKQYQRSAENAWRRNAADVAESVRSGVRVHRPDVVLLAGDDRARGEIEAALDGTPARVVHLSAGGRSEGASSAALWSEVRRVLADLEAHEEERVTDRLSTGDGADAAHGVDAVLDALVKGQVEQLLLDLDAAAQQTVDPTEHPGLPLAQGISGAQPADRVLVAAAAATDAGLRLLTAGQMDGAGVAAVLRWSEVR